METTRSEDISVVLSGGTVNINPNNSLGGDPSSSPVQSAVLNNLFDDISPEETEDGHEDYRCFYFFNDGESPVYSINIWIADDFVDGATIELGVENRNETQRITISEASVTGGNFRLSYDSIEFLSSYNSDLGTWATDLQASLNSIVDMDGKSLLRDVLVTAQAAGPNVLIFDINFNGQDGSRNHPKLVLVNNSLTPSVNISITAPQEGSPINTIAPEIGLETTPPGGVGFFVPTQISPIVFPKLLPEDGFPIWVKRVIVQGSEAKEEDGFQLKFSAESLEPS